MTTTYLVVFTPMYGLGQSRSLAKHLLSALEPADAITPGLVSAADPMRVKARTRSGVRSIVVAFVVRYPEGFSSTILILQNLLLEWTLFWDDRSH